MKVYIIGAGPGAKDLITLRGYKLLKSAMVVLYAGSLVSDELIAECKEDATVYDTSSMVLDEIIEVYKKAKADGLDVVRLHSGDPSIYGAIGEQMKALRKMDISYEIVPGVPSFAAAAAEMGLELTLPEISQSIIITRVEGKASSMPKGEILEVLGKSGSASLAIHLSIKHLRKIIRELSPYYGDDSPIIVVYKASYAEQKIIRGSFLDIVKKIRDAKITRQALIFVGPVLKAEEFINSKLYDPEFKHIFRV